MEYHCTMGLLDLPNDVLRLIFTVNNICWSGILISKVVCLKLRTILSDMKSLPLLVCIRNDYEKNDGSFMELYKWVWYKTNNTRKYYSIAYAAAERGNIEDLKWALSVESNWDRGGIMHSAIDYGHIDIVIYLSRLDEFSNYDFGDVMIGAAKCGQLKVFEWAYHKCSTKWFSLQRSRLPIRSCVKYARERGHTHIVDWIGKMRNKNS